ncbi:MAG: tRNA 2-thiouridine(34) synthase MnmA [Acidimicrobiales bacterium]
MSEKDVLVALSGGVDSAVAAALLVQQGYEVTGVTLSYGAVSDSGCCSVSDVDDARRVADMLGIEHHVFNFGDDFNEHVVDPFVAAYNSGRTPNPCIECNRHIKFDRLLRRADMLGFDLIATGHHARVVETDGVYRMARGADAAKDQSYVLHMLGQAQLRRLLLPVGSMTKDRVREIANDIELRVANKPDSQDICFISRAGGKEAFLGDRIKLKPATIIDGSGAQVGSAPAVQLVTIGQRKGIGLAGNDSRQYVTDINHRDGIITVGPQEDLWSMSCRSRPSSGRTSRLKGQ